MRQKALGLLVDLSYPVILLGNQEGAKAKRLPDNPDAPTRQLTHAILRQIKKWCAERDVRLYMVGFYSIRYPGDIYDWFAPLAAQEAVPFLNLQEPMSSLALSDLGQYAIKRDGYPTEEALALVAERVWIWYGQRLAREPSLGRQIGAYCTLRGRKPQGADMTKRLTLLQYMRKLLRSLFQLCAFSRRARGRIPFEIQFKTRRRRLIREVAVGWKGGYVLQDAEFLVYVPRGLDTNDLDLLTRAIANEPVVAHHCPAGGVALDVGAHLGTWTLPMARAMGETGRVRAFELIPFLNEALRKTVLANDLVQIVLDGRALGAAAESSDFTTVDGSHGRGNLGMSGLGARPSGGATIRVEVTTLDAFAEERKLLRLDFLKSDVEGFEDQVLAGGRDTLGRFHPIIVFETGNEDRGQRLTIRDTLRPLNHHLLGIPIEHGIVEADWDAFVECTAPFTPAYFCNVLCVAE